MLGFVFRLILFLGLLTVFSLGNFGTGAFLAMWDNWAAHYVLPFSLLVI